MLRTRATEIGRDTDMGRNARDLACPAAESTRKSRQPEKMPPKKLINFFFFFFYPPADGEK